MGELEERMELIIKKLVAIGNTLEKLNRSIERLTDSSTRIERQVEENLMKTEDISKLTGEIDKEAKEIRRSLSKLGDILTARQEESVAKIINIVKGEAETLHSAIGILKQTIQASSDDVKDRIDVLSRRIDDESVATREAFRRIETILTSLINETAKISSKTERLSDAVTEVATAIVLSQTVLASKDAIAYGIYEYAGTPVFIVERQNYVKMFVFSFDKVKNVEELASLTSDATGKPVIPVYVTVTHIEDAEPVYVASNETP
ncbi:MAG: hypothetical protein F7C32_04105 [Desulfurococcales archaeon]|nr:hypothetical protein [Desulfurococcales archaeon]